MTRYVFRLIAGFIMFLFGLWLIGNSGYISIPVASVVAALFGLLMVIIGLMVMFTRL